jgi:hypothetical protein
MGGRTYLIPANTKKGQLILNLFTTTDMWILGVGVSITLLMIFTMTADNLLKTIIILAPGLFSGFLVTPIPNYHNVRMVINSAVSFLIERRIYIWRGWCFYEFNETEKK